ncbi:hypothetical protein GCM10011505_32250 [Tistrella bauzanensis]|uniref:Gamma-butyrobetaine hydroxylase-like N-terminal domain-containing protein n=1 Tax=Tistrella bauzanensis TaxID=657419 RepID=A0ABQ1IPG6_9PROT|nr:DUF971 domain-containing protein [Tistrella bauzanensis]GGB48725.1 hypothetical protein GCM10011505_32250 [Tistrella bauzanensis]
MTGSHTHDHGHHHHPHPATSAGSATPAGPGATPWPVEIRLKRSERVLEVTYEGGDTIRLGAEYLRVESPSAEVQGHGPGQKRIPGGKRRVGITDVQPVGNYAVRLVFDDGHSTGIYGWGFLAQLAREHDQRWQAYLDGLTAAGLSRD